MVVDYFLIELYLVELCKAEIEIVISVIIQRGGVRCVINGPVGLYKSLASKRIARLIVLGNRDVKVTIDALVLLKLHVCPLFFIYKLVESLFQILKNRNVSTLNLVMVDCDFCIQFLSMDSMNYPKREQNGEKNM